MKYVSFREVMAFAASPTAAEFETYFLNCTPCDFVSFYVAFGRILS